MSEVRHHLFKR